MFFTKPYLSLVDFLKINSVDLLFIIAFKAMSPEEKKFKIEQLITENRFDFIIKMACVNSTFKATCLLPIFDEVWTECWSTLGIIITKDLDKGFYDQETQFKFDLFIGAYFYYRAVTIAACSNKECSALEIPYLKKAISFKSIHACQRYHQFLYFNISTEEGYSSETENLFKKIIYEIKQLLPQYGAYGYLMLTEAYTRYGHYMLNVRENYPVEKIYSAALESCQQAKIAYWEADPIVFNASFGGSIADSNTMHLTDFHDIKSYIEGLFKKVVMIPFREENKRIAIVP